MDTSENYQPSILSLCTGMRGIERGIERAGVKPRVLAYVEIEAFIIQNLVAQMEAGIAATCINPIRQDAGTMTSITGVTLCR